ncbi:MAG: hypothetical protein EOM30_01820 [Clostridia bacterium]|nr:hypothetical protein [Clostridia bacterium]NLS86251.1 hypothetical protein [Oscillospiraceae bacterium]
MILGAGAKRLAVFAYYDEDGVVDDYVIYLLAAVRKFCEKQIVVVNGTLTKKSEAAVREVCDEIISRDNSGFDITAYKEGFLSENAADYDEVLFYNQTVFGPVCPLDDMFEDMSARDVDFWGLTRHKGAKAASWDSKIPINPHVQSFFFAVRKPLLTDERFLSYWQNLPEIKTYWDAVGKHEINFTKHFSDYGFKWEVYIDTVPLEKYNDYPLMGMPTELLKEHGCPFFKRKSFICRRHEYTTFPQGQAAQRLYDYVRTCTDYPVALINENLTRTVTQGEISEALTLYFEPKPSEIAHSDTAVILWCKTSDMVTELSNAAAKQMNASVFCLCPNAEIVDEISAIMPQGTVFVVTNGAHGMQYLFKTLWRQLDGFKYILYLTNDIMTLLGEFYDATTLVAALEAIAVQNSSAMLDNREDIGVLLPVTVRHQECCTLQNQWKYVAPDIKAKLRAAEINVPFGEDKSGVASRAGMFLARREAISPLSSYAFESDDFDRLYSPCEYLAPLAAQSKGYLTAFACDTKTAFAQLANSDAIVEDALSMWATPSKMTYDRIHFRMQAILDFYYDRRYKMTLEQAFNAKLSFKEKLWIILQIILKPETFKKLHGDKKEQAPPPDDLD